MVPLIPQTGDEEKAELLEEMTRLSGCEFLSDLPRSPLRVHNALKRIRAEHFSLAAWREAALYIAGLGLGFQTPEESRRALLEATGRSAERERNFAFHDHRHDKIRLEQELKR